MKIKWTRVGRSDVWELSCSYARGSHRVFWDEGSWVAAAFCFDSGGRHTREEFKHRRDAKRWVLARSAGLANVPRWEPPPWVEHAAPRARLPCGWRVGLAAQVVGSDVALTFYARNWRLRRTLRDHHE